MPSGPRRQWPLLRSALLAIRSKRQMRWSRGRCPGSSWRVKKSGSKSAWMKSWNDPSPYGPSRCTVSGTRPQRSTSERCQAASSRLKRPRGKSHRGRSPRSGLYTASVVSPACVTSTRNVALELHGIRPFTVTSPRTRSRDVSVDDVAVAPGADVTTGVLGLVAPLADLPAGLHSFVRLLDECRCLRAGDQQAHRGGVALLVLQELVGDDQDAIARLVVADGDRGDDPDRVDGLRQPRRLGRRGP